MTMTRTRRCLTLVCAIMVPNAALLAGEPSTDLFNLKDTPAQPRFPLPIERVWPTEPGQPQVCLWDGDRFAAMSITIDDNNVPEHDWWLAIGEELGMRFTWFVITERIGTGSQWGTWENFERLRKAGHSIQSHTVTHLRDVEPPWQGIEWEYAESKRLLEENLPGLKALTMAYSGGPNVKLHDRELAAKYYIAARHTVGKPNPANQTDYLSTASMGNATRDGVDAVLEGTSGIPWLTNGRYLRAWLCTHFHGIGKIKSDLETLLRYVKSRESDLWVGVFADVVRYGQERDTHRLTVVENTPATIRFLLEDGMRNDIFDVPLTVKLRLHPDWKGASARQDGQDVPCAIREHEGALFALVSAVPDRGEIVMTPATR
jgi:hypothetical protein